MMSLMKYILITIIFPIFLFASTPLGDVDKGHTYFQYIINPMINIRGDKFTIKHTQKEWKKLFLNEAKEFKINYANLSPDFKSFLESQKFKKITPDIKAFLIYYAKDSDVKPECSN